MRLYARAGGSSLALLGIAGFLSGGFPLFGMLNVDPFENLLHLASGCVLLYALVGIVVPDLFGLTRAA